VGRGAAVHPGGYSWESLVGVCRPVPPNPDPISDQNNIIFAKEIMPLLLSLEQQHKRFLKIHFEFAYFSFFLTHLEFKL